MQLNVSRPTAVGGDLVNTIVQFIDTRLNRKSKKTNVSDPISPEAMDVIDQSVENFKLGKVSPAIDLSNF